MTGIYATAPHGARMAHAAMWLTRDEVAPALAEALGVSADVALDVLASLRDAGLAGAARELSDEHAVAAPAVAPVAAARAARRSKGTAVIEATDVPSDLRERLAAALESGATYRGIARELGCSESTLRMFSTGKRPLPAHLVAPLDAHIARAQEVRTRGAHKGCAHDAHNVCAHCAHPSSSVSDSSPKDQTQKKTSDSESGSDARERAHSAHAAHKTVRTPLVRTTQETPEARAARERWDRCEEALVREGGAAVDLRGDVTAKVKLKRLVERGGYTEADCAALGRYLADRPPAYPRPNWLRGVASVSLPTLVRGFDDVEGSVLSELMCSARLWAAERERQRRAREEAAERAARPRYVPDAKALLAIVFGEGNAPSERKATRAAS